MLCCVCVLFTCPILYQPGEPAAGKPVLLVMHITAPINVTFHDINGDQLPDLANLTEIGGMHGVSGEIDVAARIFRLPDYVIHARTTLYLVGLKNPLFQVAHHMRIYMAHESCRHILCCNSGTCTMVSAYSSSVWCSCCSLMWWGSSCHTSTTMSLLKHCFITGEVVASCNSSWTDGQRALRNSRRHWVLVDSIPRCGGLTCL